VESQRVIDDILVANTDSINRINKELLEVEEKIKKQKPDVGESKEDCKKQKSKEVLEKVEGCKVKNSHPRHKEVTAEMKDKEEENDNIQETNVEKRRKRCRYYDRGFCKYTSKCKFVHPSKSCEVYLSGNICGKSDCEFRHPKLCKWLESKGGCKRDNCDYRHVTLACDEHKTSKSHKTGTMKCAGCKSD
jgi:hypothetical protein